VETTGDTTRYWRIQMDAGPHSCGEGLPFLYDYVRWCVHKGINFTVTWHDTEDEAHSMANL